MSVYAASILCIYSLHTGIYITYIDFYFLTGSYFDPKPFWYSAVNYLIWLYCL